MAKKRRPISPVELDIDTNNKRPTSVELPLDTEDIRIEQKPIKKRTAKSKQQDDALEYYSAPISKEVLARQKKRESTREERLHSKSRKEASKAVNAEVDALIEGHGKKKPSKKGNQRQGEATAATEGQKKKRKPLQTALILILAIGLLGFLGYKVVRANSILVEGNVNMPAEQVVALSGIKEGTHLLRVNKAAAKEGIEADPHFIYEGVKYKFPSSIVIVVKERIETVCFRFYNAYVITDEQGLILGHVESEQPGLPLVKGIEVTDFTLGEPIVTKDTHKQETMLQVLGQMHTFALVDRVKEIDITEANAIVLLLQDGTKVELGQPLELSRKFAWMASILENLESQGISGGTINITTTKAPTYRPASADEDVQIPEGIFNPGNKNTASPSPEPSTSPPENSPSQSTAG